MSQRPDNPSVATPWISPRRVVDAAHGISLQAPMPESGRTLGELQSRAERAAPAPPAAPPARETLKMVAPARGKVQIGCRGIFKSYRKGTMGIPVLQGIDLEVREGEFVAIVGSSGCGKSTLLQLLGTLDRPDAGSVEFEGNRIDNLPARACDLLRNRHFGMIFQFYHLLPELTALENILAPALIAESTLSYWLRRGAHRRRAYELMDVLGISHRAKHKPREMSGGEMQRAAIGRALLSRPKVLLADEPTGNLDRNTADTVFELMIELAHKHRTAFVMVTHDQELAKRCDRVLQLVAGRLAG
jgi:lipoprotein-releasing system ATP-binding protein